MSPLAWHTCWSTPAFLLLACSHSTATKPRPAAEVAPEHSRRFASNGPLNVVPGLSCRTLLRDDSSLRSGVYSIDPDGEGPVAPFNVFCDMKQAGGGWTLFAHHIDNLRRTRVTELTDLETRGVLAPDQWAALAMTMEDGMMFVDEHGLRSRIARSTLMNGRCGTPLDASQLSGYIYHDENSGCSARGRDYSLVTILTSLDGGAYGIAGAALYQMSRDKFDEWPYRNSASYEEQDELWYFVR